MGARQNRMKAKLNANGTVTLKMERRDTWNIVRERMSFTMSRRDFDKALANATIEAPWKGLLETLKRW